MDNFYDNIVIGAGPAGLQMAYFLHKAGRSYKVLEAGKAAGTFFSVNPRHRCLISLNKKYNLFEEDEFNLRHDWNSLLSDSKEMRFPNYTDELHPNADLLVEYLKDYAKHYDLNIKYDTSLKFVKRETNEETRDFVFILTDSHGDTYRCKYLLMATGAMLENTPDIPGMELVDTYLNHDISLDKYTNKAVCVVGGGNSAFEVANHLAGRAGVIHMYPRSPVKMAWDSHFPGHLRAINNTIIDMVHLKALHGVRTAQLTKIEKEQTEKGEKLKISFDMELPHWEPPCTGHFSGVYDHVIFCTGWKYVNLDLFDDSCKPEITDTLKFAVLDEKWESSVPNMYFLGTNMQQRDRRAASSFIHGFRYGVKSLFTVLDHVNYQAALPMTTFETIDFKDLSNFLIKRMSTTSALYQLNYGVLCDVLQFFPSKKDVHEDGNERKLEGTVKYHYELPTQWALQQDICKTEDFWVIVLKDNKSEFGSDKKAEYFFTPPDLQVPDLKCSAFIQPLVRRYKAGQLVEEYPVGSNLMVRQDVNILKGDNGKQRVENKLKNLLSRQFNINDNKYDESLFSKDMLHASITPWDEKKIQGYVKDKRMQEKMQAQNSSCHFSLTRGGTA